MADGYNVQEMTAHYIALAQNNPQLYQTFRDLIKKEYEGWADKLTKTRDEQYLDKNDHTQVRTVVVRNNKYADATKQNVADWFAQIEETADLMKGNDPAAAKKAFDKTCKTLEKAIQNTEKANAQEEKKGRQENTFTETYLTDLDDIEPEYYEGNSQEAVAYQGKEIVRQFGTKKTAAKIIEEIQDNVHDQRDITAEHIATIIAARQIANTVPGDKSRLKSTSIDPVTLQERVDKLLASEAFQDFLEENAVPYGENHYTFDPKMLTDGHGGKLEKALSASIKSRPDLQDLDGDLYSRYQRPVRAKYNSYEAFIQANKKDFLKDGMGKITSKDKDVAVHAASMLAAFQLKESGKNYNQAYFDSKVKKVYNSPQFQFIYRHDPNKLNLLTTGNLEGFKNYVDGQMNELKNIDEDSEERYAERKQRTKMLTASLGYGSVYGTAAQRKDAEAFGKAMHIFDEKYKFLGKQHNEKPDALQAMERNMNRTELNKGQKLNNTKDRKPLTEEQVSELLKSSKKMIKFLDNYELDPNAIKLKAELEKAIRTGEKYNNPPQFRDKKGKTAEQQLAEYKTACAAKFQNAAIKFADMYSDLNQADYTARKNETRKQFGIPDLDTEKANVAKQTRVKNALYTEAVVDEFVNKRGPKYKAMLNAAKDYDDHGADKPEKVLKLIDTIIDYQKGKEKTTGSAGDRFNNSMVLLANVTVGTPLEKYLDEQIDKVNKARGARPGDKNFVTKDTYCEPFVADDPELQAKKAEEEAENNKRRVNAYMPHF